MLTELCYYVIMITLPFDGKNVIILSNTDVIILNHENVIMLSW
jgi:hypothetical protein